MGRYNSVLGCFWFLLSQRPLGHLVLRRNRACLQQSILFKGESSVWPKTNTSILPASTISNMNLHEFSRNTQKLRGKMLAALRGSIAHRIHGAAILMVTWIPYIYHQYTPVMLVYNSIYTSTMDPMGWWNMVKLSHPIGQGGQGAQVSREDFREAPARCPMADTAPTAPETAPGA